MTATGTTPLDPLTPVPMERVHMAISFSINGDLRFLSHHDELRMLARALTRAGWPVAYSRGFNPQPRIRVPLPRSVGTASECELAVVELSEPVSCEQLKHSLAAALPEACRPLRVERMTTHARPHPRRMRCVVELNTEHTARLAPRIAELQAAEKIDIERSYGPGKPDRTIDIRPYIEKVTLASRKLVLDLAFIDQRTARPTEVLTKLHLPAETYAHRVRRVEVEWDIELAGRTTDPAGMERNHVGQEESCRAQEHRRDT